ncbi:unnamed protein product [Fusarium graminearum]|nr:unnamed protein product [Fusarium graminearum]
MASLIRLPQEISAIILNQVHPRDWLSLKQTCKKLNAETAQLITDFFFRKRAVILERRSLQCLESIAKSQSLSESIEEVEFCTSHLLPVHELEEIDPPYCEYEGMMKGLKSKVISSSHVENGIDYEEWYRTWEINNAEVDLSNEDNEDSGGAQPLQQHIYSIGDDDSHAADRLKKLNEREYERHLSDQADMIRTGYDVQCVTQALTHLTRCTKINISTSIQAWGLRRLRREIGVMPQRGLTFESKASIQQVHHLIQVVLEAIAASGISVEVFNLEPNMMLMNANRINPFMLIGSSSAVLSRSPPAHLHELQITLDPDSPSDDMISGGKWGKDDLAHFFHLLPELSNLELGFEPRDEDSRFSNLIAQEVYIPRLKRVALSAINTTREGIAIFLLRHHRTVRTVILDSIQLRGEVSDWRWLIEIIWTSLELDKLYITSSWAEREYEDDFIMVEYKAKDINDIEIKDNNSLQVALENLEN